MSFLALAFINGVDRKETLGTFDHGNVFLRQIHVNSFIYRYGQALNPDDEFMMKVYIPWTKEKRPIPNDVALLDMLDQFIARDMKTIHFYVDLLPLQTLLGVCIQFGEDPIISVRLGKKTDNRNFLKELKKLKETHNQISNSKIKHKSRFSHYLTQLFLSNHSTTTIIITVVTYQIVVVVHSSFSFLFLYDLVLYCISLDNLSFSYQVIIQIQSCVILIF